MSTSFTNKIKNFDRSKLKHTELNYDIYDGKYENNKQLLQPSGKKPKVKKSLQDQMLELDKFIEDNFPPFKQLPPLPKSPKPLKKYNCTECIFKTNSESVYLTHKNKHLNDNENQVCICVKCNEIFNNNLEFDNHKCSKSKLIHDIQPIIKSESSGKYECPICQLKFTNSFILGEHFILDHNNYDVLCSLDNYQHNGFPGFDILEKIGMIMELPIINYHKDNSICEICRHNYTNNKIQKILACCQNNMCDDCLITYISTTDSVICPFCRKDHTREDWNYIIFIEETNTTNREIWIDWWINHLDIFN
jgi:hypothetical protein